MVKESVSGSPVETPLSLFPSLCIQGSRVAFCVALIVAGNNLNPNQLQLTHKAEFSLSQRPAGIPPIVPLVIA